MRYVGRVARHRREGSDLEGEMSDTPPLLVPIEMLRALEAEIERLRESRRKAFRAGYWQSCGNESKSDSDEAAQWKAWITATATPD